jgi:DNA repair photolyase
LIISASRRTDIPAFFGEWFINRIKEGFIYTINPFNSKSVRAFSLLPEDVDAFVFWSKNPKPFLGHLDYLNSKDYNYYFQFTLNDYPLLFEPNIPPVEKRIETFKKLSEKIGYKRVIWRYDPIILSTITPVEYHLEKVSYIAEKLEGFTNRIIISFLDFYGKVKNRFNKILSKDGVEVSDLLDESRKSIMIYLSNQLKKLSAKHSMDIFTCSEYIELKELGIDHGSCIDGNLIKELFNINKIYSKDKRQRRECLCAESVDIGVYNTCKFQCSYCYANVSEKAIANNLQKHRLDSASLINYYKNDIDIILDVRNKGHITNNKRKQLSFFDEP